MGLSRILLGRYFSTGGDEDNYSPLIDRLEQHRNDLIYYITHAAYMAMRWSWEVRNYPELAEHLVDVVEQKLRSSDRDLVKISGIRLSKGQRRFFPDEPDLSPLGDYGDWLSMQKAGWGSVDMFAASMDAAKGWRAYYISYILGKRESDTERAKRKTQKHLVYPQIMQARLDWAKQEELAPYWYWYDKPVSTNKAYPKQTLVGLSAAIKAATKTFCDDMSEYDEEEAYLEIDLDAYEAELDAKYSQNMMSGKYNEPIPEPHLEIYGGKFKGQRLSEEQIEAMLSEVSSNGKPIYRLSSPNIRSDLSGVVRINIIESATGRFTGLYKLLVT